MTRRERIQLAHARLIDASVRYARMVPKHLAPRKMDPVLEELKQAAIAYTEEIDQKCSYCRDPLNPTNADQLCSSCTRKGRRASIQAG